MCGIVFIGGGSLSSSNVDKFEQMLFADTFRGEHSTGVMSLFSPVNHPQSLLVEKRAVPGDVFIRTGCLKEVSEIKIPSIYNTPNVFSTVYPKFMVGHNRYATAGAINDKNAHPFTHGPITLVHNGSLTNQRLLPDHDKFEVDSENICHSIATVGIDETIKNLHGAFVLVWHNAEDNTLNFIRNDERPFYMIESVAGDWFGASEKDMIKWILSRKKYGPTVKREFELVVGTQYVFDTSGNGFKFKEERKHTLPTFRTHYQPVNNWTSQYYNGLDDDFDDYDAYYNRGNGNRSNTNAVRHVADSVRRAVDGRGDSSSSQATGSTFSSQDKNFQLNEMLESHGIRLRIGEGLRFEAFQFDPYLKNSERGQITGFTGSGEYIEVQAHGFETGKFQDGREYTGRISSCYEANYILTIIVSGAKLVEPTLIPGSSREEDLSEVLSLPDKTKSTEDRVAHGILKELMDAHGKVPDLADEKPLPSIVENMTRGSINLNKIINVDLDNDIPEDSDIYPEETWDEETVDITRDGSAYTKKEWENDSSLNCCGNCGSPVPFDEICETTVVCGFSYCQGCVDDGLVEGVNPPEEQEVQGLGELQFVCNGCGEELGVSSESEVECTCKQCHETKQQNVTPLSSYRKTLENGMRVTLSQWEEMNSCRWCGFKIPFKDAALTRLMANSICCTTCSKKFDNGEWPQRR